MKPVEFILSYDKPIVLSICAFLIVAAMAKKPIVTPLAPMTALSSTSAPPDVVERQLLKLQVKSLEERLEKLETAPVMPPMPPAFTAPPEQTADLFYQGMIAGRKQALIEASQLPPPVAVLRTNQVTYTFAQAVTTGRYIAVCENPPCGATNDVKPVGTNWISEKQLGGRAVTKCLVFICPTCQTRFTNELAAKWVPEIKPVEVYEPVNYTNQVAPRK